MGTYNVEGNVIYLAGDISVNDGEKLLGFLRGVSPTSDVVTVDMKGVERWDSSSIQMLVSFRKSLKEIEIVWRGAPVLMSEDIELMGLSGIFSEGRNG